MIKNIIFDWSGVLSNSLQKGYQAAMIVLKTFGAKELTLEEFKKEWEQPYMLFYNKYLPDLSIEKEKAIYESVILKLPQSKPYPGANEILQNFKSVGIKMLVLSSDSPNILSREVVEFGLEGLFEEVIGDVHDKTEVIDGVIKRNKYNPQETLFVGDTTHEIDAGKKANLKTAAVTWGFHNRDRLESSNPDFIIHDLKELEKIVLNK